MTKRHPLLVPCFSAFVAWPSPVISTVETDAIFHAETAQLLAQLKAQQWPIARIELHNNLPYCVLQDGSVLVAVHWDYASWTELADKCARWLLTLQVNGKKPPTVTIAITASPRLAAARKWRSAASASSTDRTVVPTRPVARQIVYPNQKHQMP